MNPKVSKSKVIAVASEVPIIFICFRFLLSDSELVLMQAVYDNVKLVYGNHKNSSRIVAQTIRVLLRWWYGRGTT